MAAVNMKTINIIGPHEEFMECCQRYIADSNIHLESSLVSGIPGLLPFSDENPYQKLLKRIEESFIHADIDPHYDRGLVADCNDEEFARFIEQTDTHIATLQKKLTDTKSEIQGYQNLMEQLSLLVDINMDVDKFFHLQFIRFRFGKMPRESYKKLMFGIDEIQAFYIPVSFEHDAVWGMYFTTKDYKDSVDYLMNSLYFERVRISDKAKGTPAAALETVTREYHQLQQAAKDLEQEIKQFIEGNEHEMQRVYSTVLFFAESFGVRKYAAHTHDSFYITGWLPEAEVEEFATRISENEKLLFVSEDAEGVKEQPPTLLKNPFFVRPFEFFVKMYGLPGYHEVDPTFFLSVTYFLMFGIMFGDLGHGIVLSLLGAFLYWRKKADLGGIMFYCGFSSMFFGLMYGELFGLEGILPALLIRPMETAENMNSVLIYAVGIGVVLILCAMVVNIINGYRQRNPEKALFSRNGVAGMVFYISLLVLILSLLFGGGTKILIGVTIGLLILTFLMMFFQEPLGHLVQRKKELLSGKLSDYILEAVFEMIETLLSFATNTVSFVRVGAFALNHVGMMAVVLMLQEMVGKIGGVPTLILGNIVVMAMEGLIVGIQVLRLEFYEMFGRFYGGEGKAYTPFKIDKK